MNSEAHILCVYSQVQSDLIIEQCLLACGQSRPTHGGDTREPPRSSSGVVSLKGCWEVGMAPGRPKGLAHRSCVFSPAEL